jgi:WD40 repeat protein
LLAGRRSGAWSVAVSPDGGLLAVGTDSAGVLLWDLAAAQVRWWSNKAAVVRSLAFSSDGRLLAAAEGSRVQVWDVQSGEKMALLKGHTKQVASVAFSPRSTAERATLLSGGPDATVRVWDVNRACERAVFTWPIDDVRAVAFAPDGMTAAAGGSNGTVVVWDLDD